MPDPIRESGDVRAYTGTSDIDVSVSSTNWSPLVTIVPPAGAFNPRVRVVLDLAKAATGFAALNTTETINFRVARKIDGTNWRGSQTVLAAALTGTLAAGRSVEIDIGQIGPTEQARVEFQLSAVTGGDAEVPLVAYYDGPTPTFTLVAA
jgi:hypothetical protein